MVVAGFLLVESLLAGGHPFGELREPLAYARAVVVVGTGSDVRRPMRGHAPRAGFQRGGRIFANGVVGGAAQLIGLSSGYQDSGIAGRGAEWESAGGC